MRKTSIGLAIALVLALFAGFTLNRVSRASAQGDSPVGVVIAYIPGASITIVDQNGTEIEYTLDHSVKIQPKDKANSLDLGSFVTIIAPASLDKGKQTAVGIVVHPKVPEGWKIPGWVATALVKDAAEASATATPFTETPVVEETTTPTETATATPTGMVSESEKSGTEKKEDTATQQANAFLEWLRSLFVQFISQQ